MDNKVTFGKWEAVCVMLTLMCTQVFLNMPRIAVEAAGNAGWIMVLYISIIVFLVVQIILRLHKRFEGKDLLDIAEYAGGNIGRIIIGTILLAYLVFIISIVLREFSEDIKVISLPNSPISFVSLFYLTGMVIGAYIGIEGLARFAAIAVPVIIVGYIIIGIGASQFYDFSKVLPLLGTGSNDIFVNSLPKVSLFSGVLIYFLITPYIKTHKTLKSVVRTSVAITGVIFTLSALIYLLVYPYPNALENFLPLYQLARMINYGGFFERAESFFLMIWATASMLYLSIGLFLIVFIFKKTFKLSYYKPMVFPFAALIFTFSLFPPNLVSAVQLETIYFRNAAWLVAFGLVPLLLIIANIVAVKKKGGGKKSAKAR